MWWIETSTFSDALPCIVMWTRMLSYRKCSSDGAGVLSAFKSLETGFFIAQGYHLSALLCDFSDPVR